MESFSSTERPQPPSQATKNTPSSRACSRKNRVYVFRDFLLKTYGSSSNNNKRLLEPGATILDVAGGKGDLSWLLLNADGISSVVVDPRSLSSTSHLIRSVRWLDEHPEERQQRAIPQLPTHQPLAALVPQIIQKARDRQKQSLESQEFLEPSHLQIKLDNTLVEAIRESLQTPSKDHQKCPTAWQTFWDDTVTTENPLPQTHFSSEPCFLPESEQTNDKTRQPIQDAFEAWSLFQKIQLVVGFHPDQATESCLDLAEVLRIPVCIVPCCVFPSEFPDRKLVVPEILPSLSSGEREVIGTTTTRVRDYNQLLQYLQQKQPKLQKETLAFHQMETSRNIVLYTLPEDI